MQQSNEQSNIRIFYHLTKYEIRIITTFAL